MRKLTVVGSGVVAGAVVLAVALLTLGGGGSATQASDGAPVRVYELAMEKRIDDGSGLVEQSVEVRIETLPSADLPNTPVAASGIFAGREGDDIILGTGSIEADLDIRVYNDEEPVRTLTLSHDGPEVIVEVGPQTAIYRETTQMPDYHDPETEVPESGLIVVQQEVVRVDSADEIGPNMELQVWGELQGDRVQADVLVYRVVDMR